MMEASAAARSVSLDTITPLPSLGTPLGGQSSGPLHPCPAGEGHTARAHTHCLARPLKGGVENVNIRLARWEIAHFSNHKHPHVSLQHKGVLEEWGGAEAGDTSVTVRPGIPQALLAKVALRGWGWGWGLEREPAGALGLTAALLRGIQKSSASEKILASLGTRRQWQPLIRGVKNASFRP